MKRPVRFVAAREGLVISVLLQSLLLWLGFMMFAWCDSMWHLKALCYLEGPDSTFIYRQKSSWAELGSGLQRAARSTQHFRRDWGREQCLEKGMAEVLIGRHPAQSEAEGGQGSWYSSVTCCHFLQQHIFTGCCPQDLILHSEVSLAAASSPLASVLSGQNICLILLSFLLLHSFRGEQASSPFPIGKKGLDMADG